VAVLTQVGGRFALPPTGVGLVLLAHAPREVQERVLAAPLQRYTPFTLTDPRQLRRVLAEVRRTGVAISDRQVTTDAVSVAAPVEVRGSVVAALSIVMRGSSAAAVRTMTPGVRAAARGISRTLDQTVTLTSARRKGPLSDELRATYGSPPSVGDSGATPRASERL
jgi:DNA-binding IclR family transcriptional regulator